MWLWGEPENQDIYDISYSKCDNFCLFAPPIYESRTLVLRADGLWETTDGINPLPYIIEYGMRLTDRKTTRLICDLS